MQPLNYLRQATEELRRLYIPAVRSQWPQEASTCEQLLEAAKEAPKFILPSGGRILNDKLRGLPDEIRLPYERIVIEYEGAKGSEGLVERVFGSTNACPAPKRIVIAEEVEGWIHVYSIVQMTSQGHTCWIMQPYAAAMRKDFDQHAKPEMGVPLEKDELIDGLSFVPIPIGREVVARLGPNWTRNAYCDLIDEGNAVLELVEALSCSNVSHEALPVRPLNKAAARRGALPFDEYRVLVVNAPGAGSGGIDGGGTHRSPREHLRRGHIRRLQSGRRIWIQSTIVNAGAAGKITSTYQIKNAA